MKIFVQVSSENVYHLRGPLKLNSPLTAALASSEFEMILSQSLITLDQGPKSRRGMRTDDKHCSVSLQTLDKTRKSVAVGLFGGLTGRFQTMTEEALIEV